MHELIQHVSGDEKKLTAALFSPRIQEADVEGLKEALRYVMVKIGLRANNWPNELEKLILIQHILEYFGGHTIDEIKLAFDMAITGKLDIDDVSCYENFSCAYFSKIMIAYRQWSAEAVRGLKIDVPPPMKIYSDQELENIYRGDIEAFYQQCRAGIVPYSLPEYFKPILVKDGLMKEDESLSQFFMVRLGKGSQNIYVKNEP